MEHETPHTDPRRFQIHGDPNHPTLVHVEKSGPAFLPMPVAEQLGKSLTVQAVRTVGELLDALQHRRLLDVCKVWPRLLTMVGVTSKGARVYSRQAWEWTEMKEAVEIALCYADQPDSLKWQEADAKLRGYAMQAAHAAESQLGNGDHYLTLKYNAATFRAFAEGR